MALSEDQKAMLRLLAQREQGYDDLAALMGLSVEEVRAKVTEALAEVEAEGAPAPDLPPPAAPEPAPEPPKAEPVPEPPAPAPPAREEEPPAPPPAEPKPPPAAKAAARAGGPKLSLPKDRGVQAAIGGGLLALIAIVVILIVGGSGGSSGSGESASSGSGGSNVNASENQQLTGAALSPVDGGEGEGRAIFGRVKKKIVLQVEATGLQPSPKGSAYAIWLYKSPKLALRVGAVRVTDNGNIAVQLPIPTELLGYVAAGAFNQIDISLTEDAAYAAEVAKAKREKRLPEHVGTSVLRGQITGPMLR